MSVNHDNPDCEDTFNNTSDFWVHDCWAHRSGRMGTFPSSQCIKMIVEDGRDSNISTNVKNTGKLTSKDRRIKSDLSKNSP